MSKNTSTRKHERRIMRLLNTLAKHEDRLDERSYCTAWAAATVAEKAALRERKLAGLLGLTAKGRSVANI